MNVYIYSEWRAPSSDTVLYLPMKNDLLDHSWNNITVSNTWVTIVNWVWHFNWSAWAWWQWLRIAYWADSRLRQKPFTISLMVKFNQYPWSSWDSTPYWMLTGMNIYSSWYRWWNLWMMINSATWNKYKTRIELLPSWGSTYSNTEFVTNTWYNFILVMSSTTRRLYINWQLDSWCNWNATLTFPDWDLFVWSNPFTSWDVSNWRWLVWDMSEYIFESKERSAQDAADYYNQIKNLYH